MIRGSCLCGEVRFEVEGDVTPIGMCHCSKCRKVSGVASNAEFMSARDNVRWQSGEDRIVRWANSSGWSVSRCGTCGSPVPKLHPSGGAWWVPAGLLDEAPELRVAGHIFVGSKAPWDEIAGDAPQHVEGFQSK